MQLANLARMTQQLLGTWYVSSCNISLRAKAAFLPQACEGHRVTSPTSQGMAPTLAKTAVWRASDPAMACRELHARALAFTVPAHTHLAQL